MNIKNFEANLLKIDRKLYKNIGIYNIGYIAIKKIGDYENISKVNPLYLRVNHANGNIEEKNGNKYSIFDTTDENWSGIKNKIEAVSSGGCDDENDYMKIKYNSDDDLPLKKTLKFRSMTIPIRSLFKEDRKLYLQVFLDETLYELNV